MCNVTKEGGVGHGLGMREKYVQTCGGGGLWVLLNRTWGHGKGGLEQSEKRWATKVGHPLGATSLTVNV